MPLVRIAIGAVMCSLMVACGGGGSEPGNSLASETTTPAPAAAAAPAPAAQPALVPKPVAILSASAGLYRGTASNGRAVYGALLSDGNYWVIYSSPGNANVIAGVISGSGVETSNTFRSSNALDFNLETGTVSSASVNATFVSQASFSGTVTYSSENVNFGSTYDPASRSSASIGAVVGTYIGDAVTPTGNERITVNLMQDGSISGAGTSGCRFSGLVIPRVDVNSYDVSVTTLGAPCSTASETLSGIAFYDAVNRRFYSSALNASKTGGFLFLGTKESASAAVTTPPVPVAPTAADISNATCGDFRYQEDAQAAYRAGARQLDGDNDGIACESLPRR